MDLEQQLKRIQYIDFLITSKTACSIPDISAKLNMSRRQTVNIVNLMRRFGAPVKYDKHQKLFYYEEDKKFTFKYE